MNKMKFMKLLKSQNRHMTVTRRMVATSSHKDGPKCDKSEAEVDELLQVYARYKPVPLTMQQFLDFGKNGSPESSYTFLQGELPVRLANIMREIEFMPKELQQTPGCKEITWQYRESFKDTMCFIDKNYTPETMKIFTSRLLRMRDRHSDLVTIMAQALLQVKAKYSEDRSTDDEEMRKQKQHNARMPKFGNQIQYFLDRLYTSRISTRMLINQHALLFGGDAEDKSVSNMVGAIETNCAVIPLVERAYENAKYLAHQYYMTAPDMMMRSYDLTTDPPSDLLNGIHGAQSSSDIECVYVPSHLYHVLFEVFKNAIRAVVEHHGEDARVLPPIKVVVVKGHEDVSIRISDRGGGIPKRLIRRVFQYLYTTAPNPVLSTGSEGVGMSSAEMLGQGGVPLAGYGYGLPLSKLYARYFNGDLELHSMDGYGTQAVLTLQSMAEMAKERLPVYHEAGSKKIYEAQLAADDWTDTPTPRTPNDHGHGGNSTSSPSSKSSKSPSA